MKAKKLIALSLAAAMSSAILCACSSADTSSSSNSSGSSSSSSASSGSTETANADNNDCALFSWAVTIDGVDYTIPEDCSKFTENGYTIPLDNNLQANTYDIGADSMEKETGTKISTTYWNPGTETKKYSECKVGCLTVSFDDNENADVVLPGNFRFDITVTVDDIIAQYGEPSYRNEVESEYNGGMVSIRYESDDLDNWGKVIFVIYNDAKYSKYNSVSIEHYA